MEAFCIKTQVVILLNQSQPCNAQHDTEVVVVVDFKKI